MNQKTFFTLVFALVTLCAKSQSPDLKAIHDELQGSWLSRGDSVSEIQIKDDSIITFRFRVNGVTRGSYKLLPAPCEKVLKFPAATGVYLSEHYKTGDICCAFAQLSPTVIKIIYPNGTEITYVNEKMMQNER